MTFEEETGKPQKNPETESKNISISDDISPRSVLEIPILGVDSYNSSSNRSNSSGDKSSVVNESLNLEGHGMQWKNLISVFKKKSMRTGRNLNRKLARIRCAEEEREFGEDLHMTKPSWRSFDYEELAVATDNFSSGFVAARHELDKRKKKLPPFKHSLDRVIHAFLGIDTKTKMNVG
ncbi:uncharacterized protein LOC143851997 isoform X1 [Tasmannia lanceolata]|uniref:uncharacterized protein LOC143851997 isoform X1 n=1 Tax=Tasmannia lanceolata TaxID=3420 RepID=UPI0040641CB1